MRLCFLLWAIFCCGCGSVLDKSRDQFGRLYYIDGAGNWDFGSSNVREAFDDFPGNVVIFDWTCSFNPLIDQTIGRQFARLRADDLAKEISTYQLETGAPVDMIALSAGTGVAVWACEKVNCEIDNVVLLSSSLSSDYDPRPALRHVKRMWVFCSEKDTVLSGAVKIVGTIDGKVNSSCVGERGFSVKSDKILQINWRSLEQNGWDGSHTGTVSSDFLRKKIKPLLAGKTEHFL